MLQLKRPLGLFIITCYLFILTISIVSAQQPPAIVSVGAYNTRIDSQKDHKLALSFDILSQGGAQAGIQYSLRATKTLRGLPTSYIHTFDEKLSLHDNTPLHKEIVYSFPDSLGGKYQLFVDIYNDGGHYFGSTKVSDITLKESTLSKKEDSSYTSDQVVQSTQDKNYSIGFISPDRTTYKKGDSMIVNTLVKLPILTPESAGQVKVGNDSFSKGVAVVENVVVDNMKFKGLTLETTVTDPHTGRICARRVETPLGGELVTQNIPLIRACDNPVIKAELVKGNMVLVDKTFVYDSKDTQKTNGALDNNILRSIVLFMASIIILCIAGIIHLRQKTVGILAVLFIITCSLFIPQHSAQAATGQSQFYYISGGSGDGGYYNIASIGLMRLSTTNSTLSTPVYKPGEPIAIGAFVSGSGGISLACWVNIHMSNPTTSATPPLKRPIDIAGSSALGTDNRPWSSSEQASYPWLVLDSSTQHYTSGLSYGDWGYGHGFQMNSDGGMYAPTTPGQYYIHFAGMQLCGGTDNPNNTSVYSDQQSLRVFYNKDAVGLVSYVTIPFIVEPPANTAPTAPTVTGPTTGFIKTNYPFTFTSTDPDNDKLLYQVDWDNDGFVDESLPSTDYYSSGTTANQTHQYISRGSMTLQARAKDDKGNTSTWTAYTFPIVNRAPEVPVITSDTANTNTPGDTQTYTFLSMDPDGDAIKKYVIDWGDGSAQTVSGIIGKGITYSATHTYSKKGEYTITANATDVYATPLTSPNSTKIVTIDDVTVSCSPSPTSPLTGDSVTWTARIVGAKPTTTYTYEWSGDDSLTGTASTISKIYNTSGIKNAQVIIKEYVPAPTPSTAPTNNNT